MKKQMKKVSRLSGIPQAAGQKVFEGSVVSVKMQKTVVVTIKQFHRHPVYKKNIRKDRKIKADTNGLTIVLGDKVKIGEVKPLSLTKHFKVLEVIKK